MSTTESSVNLPPIPAKRYFTIGEVSELCCVKPHVLRYWEQEFTQLTPLKRRGNRRYYQHHEVLLIRRIRHPLHEAGFTLSAPRNRLAAAADRAADPPEAAVRPTATAPQALPADLTPVPPAMPPAPADAKSPTSKVGDFHPSP